MNLGSIWKSNWLVGTALTLLFLLASQSSLPFVQQLETPLYDLAAGMNKPTPNQQIVIIHYPATATQASPQGTAQLINMLSDANVALIGLTALPQGDNTQLTKAIHRSGNTVLPVAVPSAQPNPAANPKLQNWSIEYSAAMQLSPVQITDMQLPAPALLQASAGIGVASSFPDSDGTVRSAPLLMQLAGHQLLPVMALSMAARYTHIPLHDIRISANSIELGPLNISSNQQLQIFPLFYKSSGFTHYSAQDLQSGKVSSAALKNKIVLIGPSAGSPALQAANGMQVSPTELNAQLLQNILQQQYITRPGWSASITLALLILTGLYLVFLLPHLKRTMALSLSSLLLLILTGSSLLLLLNNSIWVQTTLPALLLLLGHTLTGLKTQQRHSKKTSRKAPRQSAESMAQTNLMLGLSFQDQGMLDQAYEKFLACPPNEDLYAILYDLALAFERKRQFQQAISIYEYITSQHPAFRDIQTRLIQAKNADQALSDNDSGTGLSSLLLTHGKKPTLGRYEIISELGKGAMGTVYLGKDPKINRQVAIKTMPLSQEFEPAELEDVKTKFFHEAEIAGMLNHPNIVTIFDAGDEHDLAYIAMEFLDGIDLSPYTKKGKLLPITTTLKIVAKVATALQYAHNHGVIHRDIKPANIMILKNKSVKVTDFGIAHINDSSKTKAGTVLGTPSYMSPEQLSGKMLDGRSDLFSLGVMLYELVCGTRPFRAASISKLMFRIAKEPHVDVREHNPAVPECVCMLINSLLTKKPELRIEQASDVFDNITHCLHEIKRHGGRQI